MTSDERERQTRKQRIDPRLKDAGWRVMPFSSAQLTNYRSAAVEEFDSTTLIMPGYSGTVDIYGNLLIEPSP